MSEHPEYTDGMPILASKFLGGLTETDIISIIGGLKDNIEPADKDLLEDNDHGYDTDEIEKKSIEKTHKKKKNKIIKLDNLSESSSLESSSEEEAELITNQLAAPNKVGGGNVLQILASLIPTVFPKSYM